MYDSVLTKGVSSVNIIENIEGTKEDYKKRFNTKQTKWIRHRDTFFIDDQPVVLIPIDCHNFLYLPIEKHSPVHHIHPHAHINNYYRYTNPNVPWNAITLPEPYHVEHHRKWDNILKNKYHRMSNSYKTGISHRGHTEKMKGEGNTWDNTLDNVFSTIAIVNTALYLLKEGERDIPFTYNQLLTARHLIFEEIYTNPTSVLAILEARHQGEELWFFSTIDECMNEV